MGKMISELSAALLTKHVSFWLADCGLCSLDCSRRPGSLPVMTLDVKVGPVWNNLFWVSLRSTVKWQMQSCEWPELDFQGAAEMKRPWREHQPSVTQVQALILHRKNLFTAPLTGAEGRKVLCWIYLIYQKKKKKSLPSINESLLMLIRIYWPPVCS